MCKLLVAVNKGGKENDAELEKIIRIQIEDLKKERHGAAALAISRDGRTTISRSLDDYDAVMKWAIQQIPYSKLISIHTRTSSGGETTLRNVHFFESKNCLLAHNGFVSGYKTNNGYGANWVKKDKDKQVNLLTKGNADEEDEFSYLEVAEVGDCDTLQFLKELPKPFDSRSIKDLAKDKNFSGVALFVNRKPSEAYLLASRDFDSFVVNEGLAVFFSYSPETSVKTEYYKKVFGVHVFEEEKELKVDYEETKCYPGLFKLDI